MASDDQLEAAFLEEVLPRIAVVRNQRKADISAACARGREAFAEIPLDDEIFARHLARAAMRMSDGASLSALVAEDLYLACACLVGAPGAANALMAQYRPVIRRAIDVTAPRANADEVEQGLLTDLFVGSPGRPPGIGAYAGRAPLARWVEVVAQRAALLWLRRERTRATVAVRPGFEPPPGADTPVDPALFGTGTWMTSKRR